MTLSAVGVDVLCLIGNVTLSAVGIDILLTGSEVGVDVFLAGLTPPYLATD